jgi:hypothetical protein
MSVYSAPSYKKTIKLRVKELQGRNKPWTLKKLADHLSMQYTYFSKVLNDDGIHLSEDDLFVAAKALEFLPEEIDFLLLQRAHESSRKSERKNWLYQQIEKRRSEMQLNIESKSFSSSEINAEMDYLFNPLCVVVQIAMMSETFRKDTRQLCSKLGLSAQQLRHILKILERNHILELDPQDSFTVLNVKNHSSHFNRDHPLMRVHQSLFKTAIQQRLQQTAEEDKHSFLATFTLDEHAFQDLKKEFQVFLKKAEQISRASKNNQVCQISFDLLKWF